MALTRRSAPHGQRGLLLAATAWGSSAMVAGGLLLRLTVRDGIPAPGWFDPLGTLFYATPPAILSVLSSLAGALWFVRGARVRGAVFFMLSTAFALLWARSSLQDHPPLPAARPARVLFWNVMRARLGAEGVAARVAKGNPDLVGVVELPRDGSLDERAWERHLPGLQAVRQHSGIGIVARGRIVRRESGSLPGRGTYLRARVELPSGAVEALVVDIPGTPLRSRRAALRRMADLVRTHSSPSAPPLVVMGDFNVPSDSALLDPLRDTMRHAFEERGRGYAPTWPLPFPVLTLDQVWVDARARVASCEQGWSWRSDHRPVVVLLDLPAP